MNVFQISIAIGALFTAYMAWNLPNAVRYILLGSVVAIACDVYYASGWPYPAAFTFACDALICLYIHWVATEKWEFALYSVFLASVVVSLLRIPSLIADEYTYRLSLELLNWLALLVMFGMAILEGKRGDRVLHDTWLSHVRWLVHYLRSPRSRPHWSKVWK